MGAHSKKQDVTANAVEKSHNTINDLGMWLVVLLFLRDALPFKVRRFIFITSYHDSTRKKSLPELFAYTGGEILIRKDKLEEPL